MPIEVEQIQPRIYTLKWIGAIQMQEIRDSHEETLRLSKQAEVNEYIHILILDEMTSFPYDLSGLWNVVMSYPQAFAIMIVNAPLAGKTMASLINRISKRVSLKTFDSLEEAQEYAENLLQKPVRR